MATTKKTTKKTASRNKAAYYAAVVPGMVSVEDGSVMAEPLKLTDPDSVRNAENDPNFVEITKKQYEKLEAYVSEQLYRPLVQEFVDLEPSKRNAGDWVFAILLLGAGFLAGALLF